MLRGESVDHHDLPEEDEIDEMDPHGCSDEAFVQQRRLLVLSLSLFLRNGSPCP